MIRTRGDEESFSYSKEVQIHSSKVNKKNDSINTPYAVISTKTMHRQVNSGETIKPNQPYKRANSPVSSLQYYPALRYRAIPQGKLAKFQRYTENKRKHTPNKMTLAENFENNEKMNKHASKPIEDQLDDVQKQGLRKSLPQNNRPNEQAVNATRDFLKAKYQEKEYRTTATSMNSTQQIATQQTPVKTLERLSFSSLEETPKKIAAEASSKARLNNQTNYQRSTPDKEKKKSLNSHGSTDKILLRATSKQNATEVHILNNPSKEIRNFSQAESKIVAPKNHLREVLVNALKKNASSDSPLKKKDNAFSPIIKLLLERSETPVLNSDKKSKNGNRSPFLSSKSKKDASSASPSKKPNSEHYEKPKNTEHKPEALANISRKSTPLPIYLSEEEKTQYGDRSLPDYEKIELIGKGGFALVWLGKCKNTGKKVAIKQMTKTGGGDAKRNDIYYGQLLFKEGGEPREEFKSYPGIRHIAAFFDYKTTKYDDWHVSELCGKTLSSLLFDIKGEFYKGERVYGVKHLGLHNQFRQDGRTLKVFVKKFAETLDLFSNYYIVHSDIKPDNILISSEPGSASLNIKIIDFGSAYNWGDSGSLRMATPEYMPPEFLNLLAIKNASSNSIEQLAEISNPWSVDIWSFGAILLEIITGIPLWIPLKCKLENKSKTLLKYGLFAVKGRDYDKIYLKQKAFVENINEILSTYLQKWCDSKELSDLLFQMLRWDPKLRISPSTILKHPYLEGV